MVKRSALINLRITTHENSTEAWFRGGGMYECYFRGLYTEGWYGVGWNGVAYTTVTDCNMQFGTTAVELARYSVGSIVENNSFYYNPDKDFGNQAPVINFSETCHNCIVRNNQIYIGNRHSSNKSAGDVIFNGSVSGCRVENNYIRDDVNDGSAAGYKIDVNYLNADDSDQQVFNNNTIIGNTFDAPNFDTATVMRLKGEENGRPLPLGHTVIADNVFNTPSVDAADAAIRFQTTANNYVIENNIFKRGTIVAPPTAYTITGTHTGSNGAAALTDANALFVDDELIGLTLTNTTNSQTATVTDNTDTVVTGTLSGAETWDTGDGYSIPAPTNNNVIRNNQWEVAPTSFTITGGTPSVLGDGPFKLSGSTTLTNFLNGYKNQEVVVICNGAPLIDVTGTNLKGLGGVDKFAVAGDSISMTFDGAYWHVRL